MCGRFALTTSPEVVRKLFGYEERPNFPPRANVSPTEPVAVVVQENGVRRFKLVRWGFLPGWVKDPSDFPLLINARGETIMEKPAFRAAIRHRRCLIPADAFYEWRREGKLRMPFRIRRPDGAPFAMAGVWETYLSPEGSEIDTAAVVTTSANGTVGAIHHRMPVIIPPEAYELWLDPFSDAKEAVKLIRPAPDHATFMEPVDRILPKPDRKAKPEREVAKPEKPKPEPAQGELF